MRRILHLDMDAFFASVEQRDDPFLKGQPVIIGANPRGVVSTASYEARKYGVRSAMPVAEARRRCPHGVFLPGNYKAYKEASRLVMAVLHDISPLVQPASIDEAYVDITGTETLFGPPEAVGRRIKAEVLAATGLTCSVGIAPVKFLAKVASDFQKPDGLTLIEEAGMAAFLAALPVEKIPGVGKRTLVTLHRLGIRLAGDMLAYPPDFFERQLGSYGLALYAMARGEDDREVHPNRAAKSVSAENTFAADTLDKETLKSWLLAQSERVGRELRSDGVVGRTVTLKLKFSDFRQITRSKTLPEPTDADKVIFATAVDLLKAEPLPRPVRLIGVGVSHFGVLPRQLSLLPDPSSRERERDGKLDKAVDAIRDKFGREAIVRGRLFGFRSKK